MYHKDVKPQSDRIINDSGGIGVQNELRERLSYVLFAASLLLLALVILRSSSSDHAPIVILSLLAILSTIGIFGIFAFFVGIVNFSSKNIDGGITRLLADSASEGQLIVNQKGEIQFANFAYLTLTNQQDGVTLKSVERFFSGTPSVDEVIYRLSQAAKDKRFASEEIRVSPSVNGKNAFGWYRISVTSQQKGRETLSIWRISEISHEREYQETVFQELQVAINYLDQSPVGFFSLLPDGSLAYMNATLAQWLDYDLATIGTPQFNASRILSLDLIEYLNSISGASGEVRTTSIEVDLKKRDGKALPVQLLHQMTFKEEGTISSSRTVVLKRMTENTFSSPGQLDNLKYSRLFNHSPLAIASLSEQGKVIHTNPTFNKLFNSLSKFQGSLEGFPISLSIQENQRDELSSAIALAAAGQGDIPPLELQSSGDNARSLRIWVYPIFNSEEEEERVHIFALDRTELRQIEEQLAQAQKMNAVGQLAGGVAHDFNNVLQAIIGYCDLLLSNHRPTDPSFQDIMQIKQNANRAAGLVRQLLAFSRRQTLHPQVLNLSDTLSDLSHLLRRLLGEKIGLELRHSRELWPVLADMNQLETVIINLAVNARDAMLSGGHLTIITSNLSAEESVLEKVPDMPEGEYVKIEVADSGHGMPPEIIEKIFEPFFTTKDIGKGTGLGLSTVFGIIKQSGGFIHLTSEVGQGTVFKIYLPRHIAIPRKSEPDEPKDLVKRTADMTGQGVILLVEDDDPVRAVNSRALTGRGYTVLEACSGMEALAIIEERGAPVDLVISDVVMPEMDGPTLLRALREYYPDLKVIFVSGYAEDAFKKNLPEGESFNFLAKPFSLKKFVETVKEVLG